MYLRRYGYMMELLHIGIKGTVVALERHTGQLVWESRLKGSGFVNVTIEGDVILGATRGELWGLDPNDGRILWHNGLPGKGYGYVAFASSSNKNIAAITAAIQAQQQSAQSAAGSGAVHSG